VHIIKIAGKRAVSNAIKGLSSFHNNVGIMFVFEEEVTVTLNSLYEKHRQGQTSIERARQSLIQVSPLSEREIKTWCKMIYRRLSTVDTCDANGGFHVHFTGSKKCAFSVQSVIQRRKPD